MTPARRAEIRAYMHRLGPQPRPHWSFEQVIIYDLWNALQEAWDDGFDAGYAVPLSAVQPNPYRDGERQ
jgi:hypothetical protein